MIAFVGEKIEVKVLPHDEGSIDSKFYAKYKVIQRVYGNYYKDTIEFTAYDHYGFPQFAKFKNVLLFVSEYKRKYYHEKYMFNDVYLTVDNRWAGPYTNDYGHAYNENTTVKPEKIVFKQELSYPLRNTEDEDSEPAYPEPYFRLTKDRAIVEYGNYVEELFKLKKDGVLTARQLFGNRKEEHGIVVADISLENQPYDEDDLKFMAFWDSLSNSIARTGVKALEHISFDSVWSCEKMYKREKFFNVCYPHIFTPEMISGSRDTAKLNFTWTEADYSMLTNEVKKSIVKMGRVYRFREVEVKEATKGIVVTVDFIETTSGYRFYGIDLGDRKRCCR